MHELLVSWRKSAGLKPHEVVAALGIDKGLFSKFESGARIPTQDQLVKLSTLYKCPEDELVLPWLILKVESVIKDQPLAVKALSEIINRITPASQESDMQKVLREMEAIKAALKKA
ncbi:MAG: XRE family transcriptional regulator [Cytophagaceae bacterium]|nr:MAG: XRE family transcriptional regulator [Cytophagaceae bacterium]